MTGWSSAKIVFGTRYYKRYFIGVFVVTYINKYSKTIALNYDLKE